MRIGVDLGGTKTEIFILDSSGREQSRKRIPTQRESYDAIVNQLVTLIKRPKSNSA